MNTNHILYKEENLEWVYVSYISDVYNRSDDDKYMLSHQNKREAFIIGQAFYSLGYNVKIALFNVLEECDDRRYKIVFGLEPNFVVMCQKNPEALKIYYATGSYWQHQNAMVKLRTNIFNQQNNAHLRCNRLVESHEGCQLADVIFQIGSSFTIQTYPKELQHKIRIIDQSSNLTIDCDLIEKLENVSFEDFIWMGSNGSMLKGLDLVLDYFLKNTQYNLHVLGFIDIDFYRHYYPRLINSSNIIFYGYVDTSSELFKYLAYHCSYHIFPSGSEGCPGSVIALMQMGVIPIVSSWAAFDEIGNYGYLLSDLSLEAIESAMEWIHSSSISEKHELIKKNISYSRQKWNLPRFSEQFHHLLSEYIS